MNEKICKIIGFKECNIKETGDHMFRICISIQPNEDEEYYGEKATHIFLPYSDELKQKMKDYIDKKYFKCEYKTTDDIINNRSKVTELIFS